ncbi:hypothetical protein D9613_011490 [Agrocybe pediades]|uniref:C3H1-type domain-containing protein n=1 Tax=Agrocybe pediades TaxID=84607 RepID=A0A8H4QTA3_9AGAR|nr:hypothetical protein D9613_011490 [Agrocybe pediades]
MDTNMYTQWVQSPIQENAPHESRADDWPKDHLNPQSPTMDTSDFNPLADIQSTAMQSTNQAFYPPYAQQYYIQSPFNIAAYGTPWPSSVPLSSYSTLNGATTATTSQQQQSQQQQQQPQQQQQHQQHQQQLQQQQSSQQQQQQLQQQQLQQQNHHQQQQQQSSHPSTSSHMLIDPILNMNGSSPSHMQSSFSHPQSFQQQLSPQIQHQQPQHMSTQQHAQQRPTIQTSQYFPNSQHLLLQPYYRPQSQPTPQGTLSPQALHSPTTANSMMALMPGASFYGHQQQTQLQAGPSQHHLLQQQQQQLHQSPPQLQPTASPIASTSQIPINTTEPAPAPGLTPEQKEEQTRQFKQSLKPLLQSSSFSGAQAVITLTNLISNYGVNEVDAATRLEILARIRDCAGNHYYRAWSENASAIEITRDWIRAAAKGTNAALMETTMPLLHLIDRLPFTVDSLSASKLGKVIRKLVKDEPSSVGKRRSSVQTSYGHTLFHPEIPIVIITIAIKSFLFFETRKIINVSNYSSICLLFPSQNIAIKDMASNLERRWREMIMSVETSKKAPESKVSEDAKTKKRKLAEAVPSSKAATVVKKPALGTASSTKPLALKKESTATSTTLSKAATTAVKDAKADSSFFSAPKPKAKLPSFKKAPLPATVKKEETNVAMPSSFDPFQEALKSMTRKEASPAVQTPPSISTTSTNESQPRLGKNGKKKKSVTWRADYELVKVHIIERAVYDDDPVDGSHVGHSIRDLERGEGAALHAHLFEETIDWTEPLLVEMPPEPDDAPPKVPVGGNSQEKTTQEEREQTALGAVYMSLNQIPESPAEPNTIIPEEEVDKNVTLMAVGPENEPVFGQDGMPGPVASVADLVGQLGSLDGQPSGISLDAAASVVGVGAGVDLNASLAAVQSLPQEQLQMLLQQLQLPGGGIPFGGVATTPYGNPADAVWPNHQQYGTDYGYQEDQQQQQQQHPRWSDGLRGRGRGIGGGRGRGRGRGDEGCKYGDQCDYSHDLSSNSNNMSVDLQ